MLPVSWTLNIVEKGLRYFNAENLGSVGQRASKLPAVKVGGHKKKSADRPRPLSNQSARIRVVPGSNHSQSLMAGHFAALWPTDSKFSAIKDLNLLKKYTKNQEADSILKVDFVLSKWPHLHREMCKRAVCFALNCSIVMLTMTWFLLSLVQWLDV